MTKSLQDMMAEFEAKGGEVKAVPIGATALVGTGLPPLTFTNQDADQRDRAKERRLKIQSHTREDDMALVRLIHDNKSKCVTNLQLYKAMSCTNDRLQRILRDYLADDVTVDQFRAMSHEDRIKFNDKHLLAAVKVELAKGAKGHAAIAVACGVSRQRVSSLAQRYNLTIPRGDPMAEARLDHIQVGITQLERWVNYLVENKPDEVKREIQLTLRRGNDET